MAEENLPDPLAELRDIHLPAATDVWPPAVGWWILACLACIATVYLVFFLYRRWRKSAYRRQAQQELEQLFELHELAPSTYLSEANLLLKRVALSYYERDQVAQLSGEAWVAFLDATGSTHEFTMGEGQVLISGQYAQSPDINVSELHQVIRDWIRHHKPMNPTLKPQDSTPTQSVAEASA